jgi:hypothetical protein
MTSVTLESSPSESTTEPRFSRPRFFTVIVYLRISPGLGWPFPSKSLKIENVLYTFSNGAELMTISVGSFGAGVVGSSVGSSGRSLLETIPWARMLTTPGGSGLLMRTRN